MAIHPQYADAILEGRKSVELRTRFPNVEAGSVVYLYSTAPVSAIVGGFTLEEVVEDSPSRLWLQLGASLCISRPKFRSYVRGHARAKALRVGAPFELRRPASRAELVSLAKEFTLPQSVAFLREDVIREHLERLRYRVSCSMSATAS